MLPLLKANGIPNRKPQKKISETVISDIYVIHPKKICTKKGHYTKKQAQNCHLPLTCGLNSMKNKTKDWNTHNTLLFTKHHQVKPSRRPKKLTSLIINFKAFTPTQPSQRPERLTSLITNSKAFLSSSQAKDLNTGLFSWQRLNSY